jgi:hypothetical protein
MFLSPEQYREKSGRYPVKPPPREALTEITAGEAVTQEIVTNPSPGIGPIVLDFDVWGRLLGIKFLDKRALPPGLTPS